MILQLQLDKSLDLIIRDKTEINVMEIESKEEHFQFEVKFIFYEENYMNIIFLWINNEKLYILFS